MKKSSIRKPRTKKEKYYIILLDSAEKSQFFHFQNLQEFVLKVHELLNNPSSDTQRLHVFERMLPLDYFSNIDQLPF